MTDEQVSMPNKQTRKPVTLDDLTREELLQFTRSRVWGWAESDLLWAQWEVASAAALSASDEQISRFDQLLAASSALSSAVASMAAIDPRQNLDGHTKALEDFKTAKDLYDRLSQEDRRLATKIKRLRDRADRLYRRYEEVFHADVS